ncbi:MAG TPA: TonB-dependent receptor, partial [Novosphingobium sp.]
ESTAPLLLIPARQIEQVGDLTLGETLKVLPAFGVPGSPIGVQGGALGTGQSFVNFLGLGSQRTLVLIDGRRTVSSNTASVFSPAPPGSQVDLNTIPTLMVDRIETIAIGGAPIYGSDAIAGTVNVVLRDRFEGVKLDAQYGLASAGDAAEYRLGGLAGTGFAEGRGSLVAAYEFTESKGLLATDRASTAGSPGYVRPAGPSPYRTVYGRDVRLTAFSEYGIPLAADTIPGFGADIYDATGRTLAFNRAGQLVPFSFGAPTGLPFISLGGDGYDSAKATNLLAPLSRHVAMAKASYAFSDALSLHAALSYAHTQGTNLRGDTAYNTALAGPAGSPNGLLFIPLNNPFLSPADRATIAASLPPGQTGFYLARANTDIVSGQAQSTTDLFRAELGLKGDLGGRFHWDVTGTFGRSLAKGETRQLIDQNLANALAGCPGGAPSAAIPAINSTCSPFNPFGQTNSQATLDYVSALAQTRSDNRQWVFTASLRGDLIDLPGGPVQAALGYEHRNEQAKFDPGAFFYGQVLSPDPSIPRMPYGRPVPIDPVSGSYHTNEVFGEVRAPLITPDMGVALVDTLELNAAGRQVQHSTAGSAFTWTAGARYKPVADLTLRGNFTRSIRSPAVTELFTPTSPIFAQANDPCDARFIAGGPNPAMRQANCATAGLPNGFVSNIVDFGTPGTVSGDRGLRNEVADSWTLGMVFAPHGLPGLTISADWLDIRVKNAIIYADATQVMAACYDAASFPAAACSRIGRAANGQVSTIATGYINAASQRYSGLLATLAWQTPAPFLGHDSRILARIDYQYIDKLETQVGGGAVTTLAGSIGYSRHKATGTLALDRDHWSTFVRINYIGPATVDPDAAANTYDTPHRNGVAFVSAGGSVTVDDRLTLRLDVDNLFNTQPPFPAAAGGGITTYSQGIIGRYLKVGASTTF